MQGNHDDSLLLMVGGQIDNLTLNPSFGHNLCFKYPNGSCKPISNINVPKAFQWYKEIFNLMSFDPWNCLLKVWEYIGIPTPKVGAHLGVWGFIPSHSSTFSGAWNVTPGLHSWFVSFANPYLGCEPKVKVAIEKTSSGTIIVGYGLSRS